MWRESQLCADCLGPPALCRSLTFTLPSGQWVFSVQDLWFGAPLVLLRKDIGKPHRSGFKKSVTAWADFPRQGLRSPQVQHRLSLKADSFCCPDFQHRLWVLWRSRHSQAQAPGQGSRQWEQRGRLTFGSLKPAGTMKFHQGMFLSCKQVL